MATLLKQGNHYYTQFYSPSRKPKRKRIPLKTKSRKAAYQIHVELEKMHEAGEYDPWTGFRVSHHSLDLHKHSTVREVLDIYLEIKTREDWRSETARGTTYVLNAFARFVGEKSSIQAVTPYIINDFLNRDKYAYETKKSHKTKIKPFGAWLRKNKIVSYDFSLVKIYNKDHEQDETISYLTQNEYQILVDGIRRKVASDIKKGYQKKDLNALWLIDFIDWQRYSGMRISETLSLTPMSINDETWDVTIGSSSFSTKSKKKQVLPIGQVTILKKIAAKLLANCSQPDDRLFGHVDKRRTSRTFKQYVRLFLPYREDLNVHSLRHTCCIELLRREVPIYTVQRWLRHSDIRTTLKYADLLSTDVAKAVGNAFNQ